MFRENHLFRELLHRDGEEIQSLARLIQKVGKTVPPQFRHSAPELRVANAILLCSLIAQLDEQTTFYLPTLLRLADPDVKIPICNEWEQACSHSLHLLHPQTHGKIGGMNFSQITDQLYVGTTPGPEDYHTLHELGVRLVINMRVERRPLPDPHLPPLPVLWLPTFDNPLLPIPIRTLHRGVMAALEILRNGGSVYTHCAVGMHRSVAMCAAILIASGYTIEEAIGLIKQRRRIADPHTWYIRKRIERFAASWHCSLPGCQC